MAQTLSRLIHVISDQGGAIHNVQSPLYMELTYTHTHSTPSPGVEDTRREMGLAVFSGREPLFLLSQCHVKY